MIKKNSYTYMHIYKFLMCLVPGTGRIITTSACAIIIII